MAFTLILFVQNDSRKWSENPLKWMILCNVMTKARPLLSVRPWLLPVRPNFVNIPTLPFCYFYLSFLEPLSRIALSSFTQQNIISNQGCVTWIFSSSINIPHTTDVFKPMLCCVAVYVASCIVCETPSK